MVGGDVDVLVDVGAVEHQRIEAVLAFDRVAAIARIPDEGVVAAAELRIVVAAAAGDDVVAVAAEQRVVAVAAGDGVVAVAAVERELDQAGEAVSGGEDVVAAVGMLSTRFSVVPMSRENGAGLVRSKRTRVPLAVMVKFSAPLPPLTSAVSMPSPPSMRSVPSPGFQIMRSLPAWPNIWSSAGAADQRVVAVAAEQLIVAALAKQGVVAGAAEQQIVAGAAGQRVVAVAAEQLRGGQRAVGFVERDRVVAALAEHLDRRGVGDRRSGRPMMATAPPLMRMLPAASRLATMVLSRLSPNTVSTPAPGKN